jgi:hypothetical protein
MNPRFVITHLKSKIASCSEIYSAPNSIFTNFQKSHVGLPHWEATIHCEAIIASLFSSAAHSFCTKDVQELFEVMSEILYLVS